MFRKIYKSVRGFIRSHRHQIGKNLFSESLMKCKGLEYHKKEVEILALGSSHCMCGFCPNMIKGAYNLGNTGQDLYTSYSLLKKYLPQLEKLKKVILFYSVFSPGYELAKTHALKQVVINHFVFDIPYEVPSLSAWQRAVRHRYQKFDDSWLAYDRYYGYLPSCEANKMPLEERVAKHLRENARGTHQTRYVEKMIDLCRDRGLSLEIVLSPGRSDYCGLVLKNTPDPFSELRACIGQQPGADVNVLDLFQAGPFEKNDFADSDHLNPKGAQKLTRLLGEACHFHLQSTSEKKDVPNGPQNPS